jgi:proteasome lid subunit RPN8/RPN11
VTDGASPRIALRATATLPGELREAILEHVRRELPNEACGLVAGDAPWSQGGRASRWLPARNHLASPYRYELHPDDLVRLTLDIDDADEVIWAVVHSHVASAAVPSPTDIREGRHPDALLVVVSLARGDQPSQPPLRAWHVAHGAPVEVLLEDPAD